MNAIGRVVTGAIRSFARILGCTEGQAYTVVLGLILAITLAATGIPRTIGVSKPDAAPEVAPLGSLVEPIDTTPVVAEPTIAPVDTMTPAPTIEPSLSFAPLFSPPSARTPAPSSSPPPTAPSSPTPTPCAEPCLPVIPPLPVLGPPHDAVERARVGVQTAMVFTSRHGLSHTAAEDIKPLDASHNALAITGLLGLPLIEAAAVLLPELLRI